MYYLKIKDNIAIGVDISKPEISFDCDRTEEIDDKLAYTIKLPAKFVNGEWVHTEEYPVIDYPVSEPTQEPEPQDTETDLLEMAIDHEYRLTLLELGITE